MAEAIHTGVAQKDKQSEAPLRKAERPKQRERDEKGMEATRLNSAPIFEDFTYLLIHEGNSRPYWRPIAHTTAT